MVNLSGKTTLQDIYDRLPEYPEIEIRISDRHQWRELEYISVSPVHHLQVDEICIQLAGQDYSFWKRWQEVEVREFEDVAPKQKIQ